MSKAIIAEILANKHGFSKVRAEQIVQTVLDSIRYRLAMEDSIGFVGFGRFYVADRPARSARNPQTGEKLMVPARKVVKFNAGKLMKRSVTPPSMRKKDS